MRAGGRAQLHHLCLLAYRDILKYHKTIKSAAKEHGVNVRALTAVLIYENLGAEPKRGLGQSVVYGIKWSGASLGISQLEVYKARGLLNKYYNGAAKGKSDIWIASLLMNNPKMSIRLAAARMRDVKKTYKVRDSITGELRHINDWEATLAYCGCAGTPRQFRAWLEGGSAPSESVVRRQKIILTWGYKAADEYWRCVKEYCWWLI